MDITYRSVAPCDKEQWSTLFRGYREFYRLEPDEKVVARVWSWLQDPDHELRGLVAEVAESTASPDAAEAGAGGADTAETGSGGAGAGEAGTGDTAARNPAGPAAGTVLGIANFRSFARPSTGTTGLWLDDLFTLPEARGHGVAGGLIDRLTSIARTEECSIVRWITADDNATARRLYDRVAGAGNWVVYDKPARS